MEKSKLIHRALTGSATPSEREELEKWLSESYENQEEYDDLKFLYATSLPSDAKTDEEAAEAWIKIKKAIERIKVKAKRLMLFKMLSQSTAIYLIALFAYEALLPTRQPDFVVAGNTLANTMYFRDTPIQSVIDTLAIENRLSVKFSSDELQRCKFTGVFKRGTPLEVVLQVIAKAKDLHITYAADEIVLVGDGCKM